MQVAVLQLYLVWTSAHFLEDVKEHVKDTHREKAP